MKFPKKAQFAVAVFFSCVAGNTYASEPLKVGDRVVDLDFTTCSEARVTRILENDKVAYEGRACSFTNHKDRLRKALPGSGYGFHVGGRVLDVEYACSEARVTAVFEGGYVAYDGRACSFTNRVERLRRALPGSGYGFNVGDRVLDLDYICNEARVTAIFEGGYIAYDGQACSFTNHKERIRKAVDISSQ